MHRDTPDGEMLFAALSPELAAWILRVLAKDLQFGRPRWARLDREELVAFLTFLRGAVPPRYRTRVPEHEEPPTVGVQ